MKKNLFVKILTLVMCLVLCFSFSACTLFGGSKIKPSEVVQKLEENGFSASLYSKDGGKYATMPIMAGVQGTTDYIVASKHISGDYATGVWISVEMYFFDTKDNCEKYFYSLKNFVDDSDTYGHVMGPATNYASKDNIAYWGDVEAIEILLTILGEK